MKTEDFVQNHLSEGFRVLTERTRNPNCGVYLKKGKKDIPCQIVALTPQKDYLVLTLDGEARLYRSSEIA